MAVLEKLRGLSEAKRLEAEAEWKRQREFASRFGLTMEAREEFAELTDAQLEKKLEGLRSERESLRELEEKAKRAQGRASAERMLRGALEEFERALGLALTTSGQKQQHAITRASTLYACTLPEFQDRLLGDEINAGSELRPEEFRGEDGRLGREIGRLASELQAREAEREESQ